MPPKKAAASSSSAASTKTAPLTSAPSQKPSSAGAATAVMSSNPNPASASASASASDDAASANFTPNRKQLDNNAQKLYTACLKASTRPPHTESNPKLDFTSEEMLNLKVIKTLEALIPAIHALVARCFIQILSDNHTGAVSYRVLSESMAATLSELDGQTQNIFNILENFGTDGSWTKALRMKSGVSINELNRSLRLLENKSLVKQFTKTKWPFRKYYIVSSLEPDEEELGGAWYTDGEVDLELVERVREIVLWWIEKESWDFGEKVVTGKARDEEEKAGSGGGPVTGEKFADGFGFNQWGYAPGAGLKNKKLLLDKPIGYQGYPTPSDVLNYIQQTGMVQGKRLVFEDMQPLLNTLIYDAKIEVVGYREVDDGSAVETASEGSVESPGADSSSTSSKAEGEGSESDDIKAPTSKKRKLNPPVQSNPNPESKPSAKPKSTKKKSPARPNRPQIPKIQAMYRSLRTPVNQDPQIGPGSAFASTPCGRCVNFRLCDEKGPVNAENCGYFPQWLGD